MSLEADVAKRARDDGLLAPGDAVLVAASAGADSAATAALLAAAREHGLPLRLGLAHIDHGWRGPEEATADLAAVTRLAAMLQLPLVVAGPPPASVKRTEDDARRFRYGALADLAAAGGFTKVATGHHLRDQAETFLMRLLGGSGPAGLAGIPPRRLLRGGPLEVVRPVLWVDPARLRGYAIERGLPFRDDWTNACLDRDRAKIRARLLAYGDRSSAITRRLAEAADRLRGRLERQKSAVSKRLQESLGFHAEARAVEVSVEALASLPASSIATALRLLGRPLAADREGPWFTHRHATIVAGLIAQPGPRGEVDLPRGLAVHRYGGRLLLLERDVGAPPPLVAGGAIGEWTAGAFTVRREEVPANSFDLAAWESARRSAPMGRPPFRAAFDAETLGLNVTYRAAASGDRFTPLGRTGEVDVLEFLSKQGVPGVLRRGVRVAVTHSGIAWVLGHRIDSRYAVTAGTRCVALVTADLAASGRAGGAQPAP